MNAKDVTFLEDTFKKFYFEHFDLLHVPDTPNQREFGYQKFIGGMNRHISLKSDKELSLIHICRCRRRLRCRSRWSPYH